MMTLAYERRPPNIFPLLSIALFIYLFIIIIIIIIITFEKNISKNALKLSLGFCFVGWFALVYVGIISCPDKR